MKTNPSLVPLLVPIEDLREDPRNARTHSERNLSDIAASLRAHGQQKPIVARPDGTVVAGSGTLAAARRLGWTRIAVVRFAGTASEAKAYAIADNRTGDTSAFDPGILADQISDLVREGGDAFDPASIGFTEAEVAAYLGLDDAGPGEEKGEGEFEDLTELSHDYRCPSCGHRWSGKAK